VFIELRDVNYPGSTYSLTYEPASDQLKGIYYQAVDTATAFSPTDALPLSHRAKLLMMIESTISLLTMVNVLSRAINVLPS